MYNVLVYCIVYIIYSIFSFCATTYPALSLQYLWELLERYFQAYYCLCIILWLLMAQFDSVENLHNSVGDFNLIIYLDCVLNGIN